MTEHPTISYVFDLDKGYVLMATSYGSTVPAGVRLFKAPPHPDIKFIHENEEDAKRDAITLQAYIAEAWTRGHKKPDKTKVEARA